METPVRYRGAVYTEKEIDDIRTLIFLHPDRSRYLLSKELCRLWNWTQANCTLKDMVCRGLLLKLDREGLVHLPPQKRALTWLARERPHASVSVDTGLVTDPLSTLLPVSLRSAWSVQLPRNACTPVISGSNTIRTIPVLPESTLSTLPTWAKDRLRA
jgi:hypothetical protein